MISVVVLGAGGRMGRALIACLASGRTPNLRLAGAVDLWDSPVRGRDAGLVAGVGEVGILVGTDLEREAAEAGVVIDFTGHHGTAGNAPRCAGWGVPMVIGTTGLNETEHLAIEEASRRIPIVMAPNMSLGVNLLLALVEDASRALKGKGYDVEIIERHHRMKKDAPSGTALALGQSVARGYEWRLDQVSAHGRSGVSSDVRPDRQIGFHAVRGGDFVGDHTVVFAGAGESIEFSHRATSRDTFAMGALRAAEWVAGRAPGLYRMRDVLGL